MCRLFHKCPQIGNMLFVSGAKDLGQIWETLFIVWSVGSFVFEWLTCLVFEKIDGDKIWS